MKPHPFARFACLVFLWLVPLPFLVPVYHAAGLKLYLLAGAVYGLLVGAAAWFAGAGAQPINEPLRKKLFGAARRLVAAWSVALLALNMDAPPQGKDWLASLADQGFRYGFLVTGGLLALWGLAILVSSLRALGQRRLPALGFAVAAVSIALFTLIFTALPLCLTARFEQEQLGATPGWWSSFAAAESTLVLTQKLLLLFATALLVVASRRAGLLGRAGFVVLLALTALLTVASLLIHLPPAVPLLLPYLLGLLLLKRIGDPAALPKSLNELSE